MITDISLPSKNEEVAQSCDSKILYLKCYKNNELECYFVCGNLFVGMINRYLRISDA